MRREIALRFREWANRRAVRLQANVVPLAGRMRPETPAPPRARSGRGFGPANSARTNKKIGPQACAWSSIFLFGGGDGGNRTRRRSRIYAGL